MSKSDAFANAGRWTALDWAIVREIDSQLVEAGARHEQAMIELRYTAAAAGVSDQAVDAMLAMEARRECGIETNISTDAIKRVTRRIASGECTA